METVHPGGACSSEPAPRSKRWGHVVAVAAVAYTAHFALAARFGLYEDDYAFVSPALAWGWADAWDHVRSCFTTLPQGRPIGFLLGSIIPFLCFRVGGLHLVYLCASVFVVANAVLAYRLLDRCFGPTLALAGALAFTLFPGDTTHPLLTHALALQPALTFALLGLMAHVSGRRLASFALAAGALLTYESAILPFLSAPLLSSRWDRTLPRRWALHVLGVAVLLGVAVALRSALGEARVVEMGGSLGDVTVRIANSLWMGPLASLSAFVVAPRFALDTLVARPGGAAVVAGAAVAVGAAALLGRGPGEELDRARSLRAAAVGLVMLVSGYGLAFTHYPPTEMAGRGTSVHLAATLGAAMVFGAVVSLLIAAAARRAPIRAGLAAFAGMAIAVLWVFHLRVQEGFVAAASEQRAYWTRILSQAPDLAPGSLVFLLGAEPPVTTFVLTSSWADTLIPGQLFRVPPGAPAVSLVNASLFDLPGSLSVRGGQLWWNENLPSWVSVDRGQPIDLDRLIVLRLTPSGWKRWYAPFRVDGASFQPGPSDMSRNGGLEKGPLFDLLLGAAPAPPALAAVR